MRSLPTHIVAASVIVDTGSIVALLDAEAASVARLMRRYKNVPMSLADACLVRLIELTDQSTLFTLDSDFEIYRQKGRRLIPLLAPR